MRKTGLLLFTVEKQMYKLLKINAFSKARQTLFQVFFVVKQIFKKIQAYSNFF